MASFDNSDVEFLVVGSSSGLLAKLGPLAPKRSVFIVDEPEIIASRRVLDRTASMECVAGVAEAPIHDESGHSGFGLPMEKPLRLRAVLGAVGYGLVWATAIPEHWDMPGAPLRAALRFLGKAGLRRSIGSSAVRQPDWMIVESAAQVREFLDRRPDGIVLKPSNLQGSIGVRAVRSPEAVDEVWSITAVSAEPGFRATTGTAPTLMVESFPSGREVSVEAFVREDRILFLSVTDKAVQSGPSPVERGHVVPATVSAHETGELRRARGQIISGTGDETLISGIGTSLSRQRLPSGSRSWRQWKALSRSSTPGVAARIDTDLPPPVGLPAAGKVCDRHHFHRIRGLHRYRNLCRRGFAFPDPQRTHSAVSWFEKEMITEPAC